MSLQDRYSCHESCERAGRLWQGSGKRVEGEAAAPATLQQTLAVADPQHARALGALAPAVGPGVLAARRPGAQLTRTARERLAACRVGRGEQRH